jgi:hypothetical protein
VTVERLAPFSNHRGDDGPREIGRRPSVSASAAMSDNAIDCMARDVRRETGIRCEAPICHMIFLACAIRMPGAPSFMSTAMARLQSCMSIGRRSERASLRPDTVAWAEVSNAAAPRRSNSTAGYSLRCRPAFFMRRRTGNLITGANATRPRPRAPFTVRGLRRPYAPKPPA